MDHIVERIEKFAGGDKRHKERDKIEGENRKVYIIIKITPERSVIFCIPITIILKLYFRTSSKKIRRSIFESLQNFKFHLRPPLSEQLDILSSRERNFFQGKLNII